MPRGSGSHKAAKNETNYPYIVELHASERRGVGVALNRQIIQFHKTRDVQPRHGRAIPRKGQIYYRWCFSDLPTAHAFIEEFDGSLIANNIAKLPEKLSDAKAQSKASRP